MHVSNQRPLISLILAIDENFGLGKNNKLLCHLPADLAHFKQITMHKPIIMGKHTFLSIGKPLPGRQNIVLSTKPSCIEGVEVARSLDEGLALAKAAKEIMIIGGAALFKEALPKATNIYLTLIHHKFLADVFFSDFDKKFWNCVSAKYFKQDASNPYDMTFYHYRRHDF